MVKTSWNQQDTKETHYLNRHSNDSENTQPVLNKFMTTPDLRVVLPCFHRQFYVFPPFILLWFRWNNGNIDVTFVHTDIYKCNHSDLDVTFVHTLRLMFQEDFESMPYNKYIKYVVWQLATVLLETSLLRGILLYPSGFGTDI